MGVKEFDVGVPTVESTLGTEASRAQEPGVWHSLLLSSARVLAVMALVVGCRGDEITSGVVTRWGQILVSISGADTLVAALVVTVEASELEEPIVYNVPLGPDSVRATLSLPVGANRTIRAEAFDITGALAYEGVTVATILAGANETLRIAMRQVGRDPPPGDSISFVAIELVPSLLLLESWSKHNALSARARTANLDTVLSPAVTWSTTNEPVVRTLPLGLLQAGQSGRALIYATAGGAAGSADVVVAGWDSLPASPLAVVNSCDDCSEAVELPFSFSFYGVPWDSVFVSSNGYITFGTGESGYLGTLASAALGPPRIAAVFSDLRPSSGGSVSWRADSTTFVVTWRDTRLYSAEGLINAQLQLWKDGRIVILLGTIDELGQTFSLGLSPGNAAPVHSIDITALPGTTVTSAPNELIGQEWPATSVNHWGIVFIPTSDHSYVAASRRMPALP